jgi:hypothetical protein
LRAAADDRMDEAVKAGGAILGAPQPGDAIHGPPPIRGQPAGAFTARTAELSPNCSYKGLSSGSGTSKRSPASQGQRHISS